MRFSGVGVVAALAFWSLCLACTGGGQGTASSGSVATASTGRSVASGSSTGGLGSSIASSASGNSSTGAGGASSSTSGGSSTGGFPVFADGGYVRCAAQVIVDGGTIQASWLCPPGTYFCQSPDSCAGCLTDADCTDDQLPTFDSRKMHCDLDSGIAGYQNFCQECVRNTDCSAHALDDQCDLAPSSVEPGIENFGFETCANLGPGCLYETQPGIGGCVRLHCFSDADCAGAVSSANERQTYAPTAQEAKPFCVGGVCSITASSSYFCPNCFCYQDVVCVDPNATCDQANDHCACTSTAQCGGAWPICEIPDGGDVDDAGVPLGSCGCESDADCGDAGLKCLELPPNSTVYGGKACLFDCTDPEFPGCADVSPSTPICNLDSGICLPCEIDAECQTEATGLFVGPFCRGDGQCGCQVNSDCPHDEACGGSSSRSGAGGLIYQCIPPPPPCTPETCEGLCDWDGGTCLPSDCASDFDCWQADPFCDLDAGCVQCRDNSDCLIVGQAALGEARCVHHSCTDRCVGDVDCVGSAYGTHCVTSAFFTRCGCVRDSDCASSALGPHCDTDTADGLFGSCTCKSTADCSDGLACRSSPNGKALQCAQCQADMDCPSGFSCDGLGTCRSRCDDGGQGCLAPDSVCDDQDLVGANGIGMGSNPIPGAVWCYACLQATDCGPGLACRVLSGCGTNCDQDSNCRAGERCNFKDHLCQGGCDAGACPAAQVCDSKNVAGGGFDICQECLTPADCPGDQGCNSKSYTCGGCEGPTAAGGSLDCPPDAICSNYWSRSGGSGVCLQNCDVFPCEDSNKTCAVFPNLTPDHRYCFGCLQDSDCGDAGARCDTSVGRTFTCKVPAAP